ncbi:MAG: hypothetical protein AAF465_07930 [Pseudomonadota bacterium]
MQQTPWGLARHLWAQKFQQNPLGTIFGSLLVAGGLGLMLFFGFFVVIALVVIGLIMVIVQSLSGGSAARSRGAPWSPTARTQTHRDKEGTSARPADTIEGEYTIVPDEK